MPQTASAIFTRLIIAWVSAVERRAALVIAGTFIVTAVLLYYTASVLTVNTDTSQMISGELPFRKVYADYKRQFPQFVDNLLVVVEADVPELAESTAATLAGQMENNTGLFSYVFAPASEPFFERNGLMYLDPEDLSDLIDRLAEVEPLLGQLSADPSLRGLLEVLGLAVDDVADGQPVPNGMADAFERIQAVVEARLAGQTRYLSWQDLMAGGNEDLSATRYFIVAQPTMDFSSLQPARAALNDIREIADDLEAATGGAVSIRITGQAALNTEELSSVSRGAALAGTISLLLVAFLLIAGLRSLKLVAAALITLIVGLIWTASFATAAIGFLNMISVAFAVLFIGLGIDFGVHFCLRYKEEVDRGLGNERALREAAGGVGVALALCAPTTALAFYAFIPTAYSGLGQLGLISGTGMFIALFVSLTVLPALLTVMPLRAGSSLAGSARRSAAPFIRRHGKLISGVAVVVGLLALPLVPSARFDFDPMKLRDPGTESVQTIIALFDDPATSPYTLQVLVASDDEAAAIEERLEALNEVDRAVSLRDLVPGDQDEKLEMIDDASLFLTPVLDSTEPLPPPSEAENREALEAFAATLAGLEQSGASPALLETGQGLRDALADFDAAFAGQDQARVALEDALFRFLPYQLEKLGKLLEADYIGTGSMPAKLLESYRGRDGTARIEVFPTADLSDQDQLRRFVRAVQTVVSEATGPTVQIVEGGDAVVAAIREATLWAAFLITTILAVVLRRIRDVILVLVPLTLAALYTVAATVLLDLPFNFANVIVLPLLIGLGVDGGIHLVMRAREDTGATALLDSSTPRAVLLSALTTIGSFGSLAISSHRGTASMGELLMIAIALTLVCTLVVLPAMMAWFEPRE